MRATGCSERVLAVVLALAVSGCTSSSSNVVRGAPVRGLPGPWGLESRNVKTSLSNDVLSQQYVERRCATVVTETPVSEVTTTQTDFPLGTLLGAAGGIAGGAFLIDGFVGLDESESAAMQRVVPVVASLIIGAVLAGVSIPMLASGKPRIQSSSDTTRPLQSEYAQERECRDASGQVTGQLGWMVEVAGLRRKGQTGPSGTIDLAEPVIAMVLEAAERPNGLRGLIQNSSVKYTALLGDSALVSGALSTRRIPDSFFAAQAAKYETSLEGDGRNKWDNCKLIARTSREQFECFWSQ